MKKFGNACAVLIALTAFFVLFPLLAKGGEKWGTRQRILLT